jgi:hypothetical protein
MIKAIIKFFQLSAEEKKLFYKAVRIALLVRMYLFLMPSHKLSRFMGSPHKESLHEVDVTYDGIVTKVFRAMRRSSVYLPFKEKCLVDAIVAKKILKKYNIETTLYLGVAKNGSKELIAHAWLRYGDSYIVGKKGMGKFIPVEWYS